MNPAAHRSDTTDPARSDIVNAFTIAPPRTAPNGDLHAFRR